jgi:hypothetical protein
MTLPRRAGLRDSLPPEQGTYLTVSGNFGAITGNFWEIGKSLNIPGNLRAVLNNEKRRSVVRRIIKERFSGQVADFARSIDRSPAQVWQFMNQRNIGERLARDIEDKLGLPKGALDGNQEAPRGLTADELELLEKYRRSKSAWRALLQKMAGMKPRHQQETLSEALTVLVAGLARKPATRKR